MGQIKLQTNSEKTNWYTYYIRLFSPHEYVHKNDQYFILYTISLSLSLSLSLTHSLFYIIILILYLLNYD